MGYHLVQRHTANNMCCLCVLLHSELLLLWHELCICAVAPKSRDGFSSRGYDALLSRRRGIRIPLWALPWHKYLTAKRVVGIPRWACSKRPSFLHRSELPARCFGTSNDRALWRHGL